MKEQDGYYSYSLPLYQIFFPRSTCSSGSPGERLNTLPRDQLWFWAMLLQRVPGSLIPAGPGALRNTA